MVITKTKIEIFLVEICCVIRHFVQISQSWSIETEDWNVHTASEFGRRVSNMWHAPFRQINIIKCGMNYFSFPKRQDYKVSTLGMDK